MSLIEQIEADLATAMKLGDTVGTGILRLLKNSLKNEQIKSGHELSDEETLKVLAREAKQRRDSIEAYKKGGRDDLVAEESAELEVIERYRPRGMEADELARLVDRVIAETKATDRTQTGRVIGLVMGLAKGRADGGEVARMVRERLN